jgi:hypothetical protein
MNDSELAELALDLDEGVPATGVQARSIVVTEPASRDPHPPASRDVPRM